MKNVRNFFLWLTMRGFEYLMIVVWVHIVFNRAETLDEIFDVNEVRKTSSYLFYFYLVFMYAPISYAGFFYLAPQVRYRIFSGLVNGGLFILTFLFLGMMFSDELIADPRFWWVGGAVFVGNILFAPFADRVFRWRESLNATDVESN